MNTFPAAFSRKASAERGAGRAYEFSRRATVHHRAGRGALHNETAEAASDLAQPGPSGGHLRTGSGGSLCTVSGRPRGPPA